MTLSRLCTVSALALSLALPTIPAFASMTPNFSGGFSALTGDADALVIDVRQGRSGTGLRGRDRDRDDDDDDRGRGRGSDDDDDHYDDRGRGGSDDSFGGSSGGSGGGFGGSDDDGSGSGRDRPRIPGGSGCDDPEDLIEHPECLL